MNLRVLLYQPGSICRWHNFSKGTDLNGHGGSSNHRSGPRSERLAFYDIFIKSSWSSRHDLDFFFQAHMFVFAPSSGSPDPNALGKCLYQARNILKRTYVSFKRGLDFLLKKIIESCLRHAHSSLPLPALHLAPGPLHLMPHLPPRRHRQIGRWLLPDLEKRSGGLQDGPACGPERKPIDVR